MTYGYARCSTNETKQDINREVRELKAAGAEEIFLEYEHCDSKVKPQLEAMFAAADPMRGWPPSWFWRATLAYGSATF